MITLTLEFYGAKVNSYQRQKSSVTVEREAKEANQDESIFCLDKDCWIPFYYNVVSYIHAVGRECRQWSLALFRNGWILLQPKSPCGFLLMSSVPTPVLWSWPPDKATHLISGHTLYCGSNWETSGWTSCAGNLSAALQAENCKQGFSCLEKKKKYINTTSSAWLNGSFCLV